MSRALILAIALGFGCAAPADARLPEIAPDTTHVFQLRAGAVHDRVSLWQPRGVVLRFRLTLPRGTRAWVKGLLPDVGGVGAFTKERGTCRARGARLLCEQSVEWCPMPSGTWRFTLRKLSGPAGTARLEFVVGRPPR